MSLLSKKEWLEKLEDCTVSDLTERNRLWWETVGQWTVEKVRLLCAEKTCRSCRVYGKPEIKPGSWVHKKDVVGNFLANPHTCSAAIIWAAELIGE